MNETQRQSGYLPGLDGWRALAIVGVLMTHDRPWVVFGHSNAAWKGYGGYGVFLFFAISGVLICTRILRDEQSQGSFRIRDFYIRRLFRIQPAAFAYLAVIALFIVTGVVHEHWHFWLGALFLYQNFLYHAQVRSLIMAGYFTGHFWTLAVEEQFYLLLSLFLFYVKRYRAPAMLLLLLALYAGQQVAIRQGLFSLDVSPRRTFWVLQYLFFPAFLALLLRFDRVQAAARRFLFPWVTYVSIPLLIVADHVRQYGYRDIFQHSTIDSEGELLFLSMGLVVIATMLHPGSWSTRILELAPIRFLGRLSYSIYLWHLLFVCTGEPETHMTWTPLVILGQRPVRYLSILAVATLSYYLIEKPLIRLGHRLAPPATPGHADLASPLALSQEQAVLHVP